MAVYALCLECEMEVGIDVIQVPTEDMKQSLNLLHCLRCGQVLNMSKPVRVTVVPDEYEEQDPWAYPVLTRLLWLIPESLLIPFNKAWCWLTGDYFVRSPTLFVELPQVVEPFTEQLEKMSGLKYGGEPEQLDAFFDESLRIIAERECRAT